MGAGAQQVGAGAQQLTGSQQQLLQHLFFFLKQPHNFLNQLCFFFLQQQLSQQLGGAQQVTGAQQVVGAGAQQEGSGAQHEGSGAQHDGSGAQQPLCLWCPNKPASAWLVQAQQIIKAAVKVIHFISEHLLNVLTRT